VFLSGLVSQAVGGDEVRLQHAVTFATPPAVSVHVLLLVTSLAANRISHRRSRRSFVLRRAAASRRLSESLVFGAGRGGLGGSGRPSCRNRPARGALCPFAGPSYAKQRPDLFLLRVQLRQAGKQLLTAQLSQGCECVSQ